MSIESEAIAHEKCAALRALITSPAWRGVLAPEITRRAEHHAERTRARDLTPAQRAEHIEAAHALAELAEWPEKQLAIWRGQCN